MVAIALWKTTATIELVVRGHSPLSFLEAEFP